MIKAAFSGTMSNCLRNNLNSEGVDLRAQSGDVRAQKPLEKSYFMDAESVRKTLKNFNLTTTNAIPMKLTTIMYLHESVNRKPLGAKISVFRLH